MAHTQCLCDIARGGGNLGRVEVHGLEPPMCEVDELDADAPTGLPTLPTGEKVKPAAKALVARGTGRSMVGGVPRQSS